MEYSKFKNNTMRVIEYIVALSFIIPYMETAKVSKILEYKKNGVIIPASISIMVIITIALYIISSLYSKRRLDRQILKIILLKFLLDVLILIRGIYTGNMQIFLSQFLWIVIPFYYSVSIIKFIDSLRLNIYNVGKIGISYYTLYIFMNILINLQRYEFTIYGDINQSRLISPGGGPVVLGYTIVLIISYILYMKSSISIKKTFITVCILTVGGILTGSRGAIWPIILLILLFLKPNKWSNIKILGFILFIIITILLNPISFLGDLVPRITNLTGGIRTETLINSLKVFWNQSILSIILGTGIGGCFPYQLWLSNSSEVLNLISYNTFIYNGQILLVQPHNSYIYLLLETGLIGMMFFLSIFINAFKIIRDNNCQNKQYKYLLLLLIIILNGYDAIFIIQPGSAGLWWTLLVFILYDSKIESTGTKFGLT